MFRGPELPEIVRPRLEALGYAPQAIGLLMAGLPLVYSEQGELVIAYSDGHRLQVERHKEYDSAGTFVRYRYQVVRPLTPAAR